MNHPLLSPPQGPLQVPTTTPTAAEIFPDVAAGNLPPEPTALKFSLVIPTYNERGNVAKIVAQLTQLLDGFIPCQYELILVDDDSPDRTWQVAQDLIEIYPQLRVMRRQKERGLSSAVIRGWQVAQGEILGVIDADLQHPPEVLLQLLQKTLDGADLSVASRHVEGGGVSDWSVIRRFLSRGAQVLGLIVCPAVVGRVSDPMSGYFMVRRSAIAGHTLNPLGYKILLEVIGRGNIGEIAEAGYVFQERESGESKVTWKQYVEYLGHLARLRFSHGEASPTQGRVSKFKEKFPTGRFLRYGLVGFSGVFVDMAILYLLTTTLGWGLTRSKIIAAEVAIISNFLWNDAWTFADMAQRQKGWSARLKRLLKFNTICLTGLILDVILLNVFYNFVFGQSLTYVANLIAIGLVAIWNFWINFKLSWRVTAVGPPKE
ncbi:MAG: glycosyltransferase [Cyanobacteria bacterium J06598_3]